jgi:anti-sigma regulatory factor (Ser/Thr protein kinase)
MLGAQHLNNKKSASAGPAAASDDAAIPIALSGLAPGDTLRFDFRDIDQVSTLARRLAELSTDPIRVSLGLVELMLNAIEHGILSITSEEKRALTRAACFQDEVRRRLVLPDYSRLMAEIEVSRHDDVLCFVIRDPGPGFDWRAVAMASIASNDERSGRGIAIAARVGFLRLEYRGRGNEVVAWARAASMPGPACATAPV